MSAEVTVLIADDQALVRAGLALVLGSEPGVTVVAQCDDGDAVAAAVRQHRPDVVLMDVRMARLDGPSATRLLRGTPDAPPVLALTTFDDDEVLWAAVDAGSAGFVLKDSPPEALVEAVRAVAGGGSWLDPRVLPRVLDRARSRPARSPEAARALARLTPREAEVMRLLCRGASNDEIAGALRLGERTVKSHVSAILAKLGARDRAAAIVTAYAGGMD